MPLTLYKRKKGGNALIPSFFGKQPLASISALAVLTFIKFSSAIGDFSQSGLVRFAFEGITSVPWSRGSRRAATKQPNIRQWARVASNGCSVEARNCVEQRPLSPYLG